MSSTPNGQDRSITPAYALSSELQAVKEHSQQVAHNSWRNTARIEHLENLMNGIEDRLARRTGAQIELQLSPVAKEIHALRLELHAAREEQRREGQELRAGIFEALGVAKGAEKDARHAIREAEMASDTNERSGQFIDAAAERERLENLRRADSIRARADRRALAIAGAKKVGGWLLGGGAATAILAAALKACGGF